jgi:hypothetical protein
MEMHVDRLTIHAPGLSEENARRLPRLVAERLAMANAPGAAEALAHLRLTIAADAGEPVEATAERVAAAMVRALVRWA